MRILRTGTLNPREPIEYAVMDKAYDSDAIRTKLNAKGIHQNTTLS